MSYDDIAHTLTQEDGIEISTLMKTPCLRYRGDFVAMMFEREDTLIIKVSAKRVNELIETGEGSEFNFTKKKFKEWVMIPLEFEDQYEDYIREAITYAKSKSKKIS